MGRFIGDANKRREAYGGASEMFNEEAPVLSVRRFGIYRINASYIIANRAQGEYYGFGDTVEEAVNIAVDIIVETDRGGL